ncbi:MAG TPA: 50S ribosomal protein L9 [Fimbriimonadaceae bacterium]|nr:50S ribosomal protein L9 [Fimbriimonadaceae bacterium]
MKVILNQTVPKVGKEGTVVNVADGFARNYLFPRKLAIVADKKQVEALNKRHERLAAKESETLTSAEALREKLEGKAVRIEGKVGADQGKLFGAVTAQDVTDAIRDQLGVTLERKQVALIEPIKRLGNFPVQLDLHRQVDAHITVTVFDPNAPVEEAPKPEAATPEAELEAEPVEA